MSYTIAHKPVGPTYALSVANTQHAAVAVAPVQGDISRFAEFVNLGATDVCVVVAPYAATPATPTLVFPVDGTPTVPNSFMLPHGMVTPRVVAIPANGFSVSAIGSAAGPSIIYITQLASL
jgi:hypothetical protein